MGPVRTPQDISAEEYEFHFGENILPENPVQLKQRPEYAPIRAGKYLQQRFTAAVE